MSKFEVPKKSSNLLTDSTFYVVGLPTKKNIKTSQMVGKPTLRINAIKLSNGAKASDSVGP